MSDPSFTFFEIHLHDGIDFRANAEAKNTAPAIGRLFGSSAGGDESEPDAENAVDTESEPDAESADVENTCGSKPGPLAALALLGLLAVAAAAAVALSRRGSDGVTDLTDLVDGE